MVSPINKRELEDGYRGESNGSGSGNLGTSTYSYGKISRSTHQEQKPPVGLALKTHGNDHTTMVWGSESNSFFVDVISVGPISNVDEMYLDGTDISSGEFPKSKVFMHDGLNEETPWAGNSYPYVERTIAIGKDAEILDKKTATVTSVTRQVTGLGVKGIRLNFTTPAFKQTDDKGRRKKAVAQFKAYAYNAAGTLVRTVRYPVTNFHCQNPTMIELTLIPTTDLANTIWTYKVEMTITGNNFGVVVAGSWSLSTATELFLDTQTYKDIAFASGTIVASDTSGRSAKRQYLVDGYKVQVPKLTNNVFTGFFEEETSNSHAYNAMAVIIDDKWGGGRGIDDVLMSSFIAFENYCAELIGGQRRYSHSQHLTKSDNYYRVASRMVGAADGRLYQDASGRIGVLIDKATDSRRVITSYDLVDAKMRTTTVPNNKKVNVVEGTFEDKDNSYEKSIIQVQSDSAVTASGVISKKLKLDTCTRKSEALRVVNKFLAISQVSTDTYKFSLGPSHEDVQIGEILEVYNREHSRINFCGKVAAGSTSTVIKVDKRTPIDLTGITSAIIVFDNDRGTPINGTITSFTKDTINVTGLSKAPTEYESFGVRDSNTITGVQPILCRVIHISDQGSERSVEAVTYNHSLYAHVDTGGTLVVPVTRYLPNVSLGNITSVTLVKDTVGLKASWVTSQPTWASYFYWAIQESDGTFKNLKAQRVTAGTSTDTLLVDLEKAVYRFGVATLSPDGKYVSEYTTEDKSFGIVAGGSTLSEPTLLGVSDRDGNKTSTYTGRAFTAMWEQVADMKLSSFSLEVSQGGKTVEVIVNPELRKYYFSETYLTKHFGDYDRSFTLSIKAVDNDLKSTSEINAAINNPSPLAPVLAIDENGSVSLGTTTDIDVVEAIVKIWKDGTSESGAETIASQEFDYVSVPDSIIDHDGSKYNYKAWWTDSFGDKGTNSATSSYTFNSNAEIPEPPSLTRIIPVNSSQVAVEYSHDTVFLRKLQVEYRLLGISNWITVAKLYEFPILVDDLSQSYDDTEDLGLLQVTGLAFNQDYEFRVRVSNESSIYSDWSNTLGGSGKIESLTVEDLEAPVREIVEELDALVLEMDPRVLLVEGVVAAFADYDTSKSVFKEAVERKNESVSFASSLSILQVEMNHDTTGAFAKISALDTVVADNETAMASRVSVVETGFASNTTSIGQIEHIAADSTSVSALALYNLDAVVKHSSTGLAAATGNISQLNFIDASSTSSLVQNYLTLKGAVNHSSTGLAAATGNISQLNNLDISSTSALVQSFLTLSGDVNDEDTGLPKATADITALNNVDVNSDSALASAHATLTAQVNHASTGLPSASANITQLNTVTSNSGSANARSLYTLNAQVNNGTSGLAAVRTEAKAAIGYCKIGSAMSDHNKAQCSAAGGTWVDAGMASAIKQIQVTSTQGSTATVGSAYQAHEDLKGQVTGKAMMGVNASGVFTGLEVIGGTNISKLTFKGDDIAFQDTAGANQLVYSNGDWVFSGKISAATMDGGSITAGDFESTRSGGATVYIKNGTVTVGASNSLGDTIDYSYVTKTRVETPKLVTLDVQSDGKGWPGNSLFQEIAQFQTVAQINALIDARVNSLIDTKITTHANMPSAHHSPEGF